MTDEEVGEERENEKLHPEGLHKREEKGGDDGKKGSPNTGTKPKV